MSKRLWIAKTYYIGVVVALESKLDISIAAANSFI